MRHDDINRRLEEIAKAVLDVPTLETRRSDSLDFHDVAVWSIRDALLAAYHAGRKSGPTPRSAPCPRCGSEVTVHQITT